MINAFSLAYDELFFNHDVFGILLEHSENFTEEVCVNATEFDNGMLFRFQNAGVIGNKFLKFNEDDDSLAKLLACETCRKSYRITGKIILS